MFVAGLGPFCHERVSLEGGTSWMVWGPQGCGGMRQAVSEQPSAAPDGRHATSLTWHLNSTTCCHLDTLADLSFALATPLPRPLSQAHCSVTLSTHVVTFTHLLTSLAPLLAAPPVLCPQDLDDMFSRYGRVIEVRLVRDVANGRCKGFGFVAMETAGQVDKVRGGVLSCCDPAVHPSCVYLPCHALPLALPPFCPAGH
jgi:hypothetical protein